LYDFFAYFGIFLYFCSVKAQIMAIGNVTPDSFYAASRLSGTDQLLRWARTAIDEGADILDIGACSTRPGSTPVDEEGEWSRLAPALEVLRGELPAARLSIDTFRPEIARRALEQFGALIINDISGGCQTMYELVQQHGAPYIYTFCGDFKKLEILDHPMTANWILDPGFGFCGGVEADYTCLRQLDTLRAYHRPILVGVSRKSMIWRPLGITPEQSLMPTQALHLYALEHGATILRVHDVHEAKQTITLHEQMVNSK